MTANLRTQMLRLWQQDQPDIGPLFAVAYELADRMASRFFPDWDLPGPLLSFAVEEGKAGYYLARDGIGHENVINLNPYVLKNGVEMAETLAHEMMHLWLNHVGQPTIDNFHDAKFHSLMMNVFGIHTTSKHGRHTGYVDDTWAEWLAENDDLCLASILLPGMNALPEKKPRRMLRHYCPDCGASFHSRSVRFVACTVCANRPDFLVEDA